MTNLTLGENIINNKITKTNLEKALRDLDANFTQVARRLKVSRQAVYDAVKRYEMQAVVDECREEMVDIAENALHNLVRNEHASAIMFYLRTMGKGRGYVERQETTGADGDAIKIQSVEAPPRSTSIEDWVEKNRVISQIADDD